jgi:hypothetical protein
MNHHVCCAEASLLRLPSLVPSRQSSGFPTTALQESGVPAVAPPAEAIRVALAKSGLLSRPSDPGLAGPVTSLLNHSDYPSPLNQLPWEIAQSEFGAQGADLIGVMGTLLLHSTQSQLKSYLIDSRSDVATLLDPAVQSQMPPGANCSCAGDVRHAAGALRWQPTPSRRDLFAPM